MKDLDSAAQEWFRKEFRLPIGINHPEYRFREIAAFKAGAKYEQEKSKLLVEALETAIKVLICYEDVKIESPNSIHDEYLAFKCAGVLKEALAKYREEK